MVYIEFNPKILKPLFDLKIRELCKSCKRFGYKQTCPPHISPVKYYEKLLPTYKHGVLIYHKFAIYDIERWKELGQSSSKEIQQTLWDKRSKLLELGKFAIIFGAGSCKLCPECAYPCRHPEQSTVPLEGTGINVVKLMAKVAGIELIFPVTEYFYRVGVVLYD
jgi:predicted metal-binding protein